MLSFLRPHHRLWMWTDSDAGTVTFKLREAGFLKRYEGTWTITAGCGSPLAAFSTSTAAAAAGATSTAAAGAVASPASSTYDLRASSSSGSGGSSSRGSSPGSSPRSLRSSSWADGVPTAEIFGATISRNGSGASNGSNGSSISMRTLPLASVTAAGVGSVGLPQAVGEGVSAAAATLGSTISSTMWRLFGYNNTSNSNCSEAVSPSDNAWPPLFKPSTDSAVAGAINPTSSHSSSSSSSSLGSIDLEPVVLRPMATSAVISASTLTSPKLTPPYPLNGLLKVQSKGQVEEMLEGLVRAATAKLQAQPLQGL